MYVAVYSPSHMEVDYFSLDIWKFFTSERERIVRFLFYFKLQEAVKKAKEESGITILELNWEDQESFSIPDEDIFTSCVFIHKAISSGHSVLVHCAQVAKKLFNFL